MSVNQTCCIESHTASIILPACVGSDGVFHICMMLTSHTLTIIGKSNMTTIVRSHTSKDETLSPFSPGSMLASLLSTSRLYFTETMHGNGFRVRRRCRKADGQPGKQREIPVRN